MRRSAVGALLTPWAFGRSEIYRVECFHQTNPFSGRRGWRVSVFDVCSCELRKNGVPPLLLFDPVRECCSSGKTPGAAPRSATNKRQKILARGPYRCDSWKDLESRITDGTADRRITLLSLVSANPEAISFLSGHLDDIVKSISQAVLTSSNQLSLREIVYEVFTGQRHSMSLADVCPSLPELPWEPANLGPDPHAVMFAAISVNGAVFRLVATRIYAPRYFRFDSEISVDPDVAEPYGGKVRIMWSNPRAWRDAAQAFLSAADDDWDAELALPEEELDEAMAKHASWFDRAMAVVNGADYYTDDEERRLAPYVCSHGPYAIFGFPHGSQSIAATIAPDVDCHVGGAYATKSR